MSRSTQKRGSKRMHSVIDNDENQSPAWTQCKRKRPVASRSMPNILNESAEYGSPHKLWDGLCDNDTRCCSPSPLPLHKHPMLQPHMRFILMEWLMNVCEELQLHRETFYLTLNYLDRYLRLTGESDNPNEKVGPANLQLVGVTCLHIASKVEEIYPPKLAELTEFTNGACTANQARRAEQAILETLKWDTTVMTSIQWLAFYMHLLYRQHDEMNRSLNQSQPELEHSGSDLPVPPLPSGADEHFMVGRPLSVPLLARDDFVNLSRALDLSHADIEYARFTHSELSAALLLLSYEPTEQVEHVVGYTQDQLSEAILFMEPYYRVVVAQQQHTAGVVLPDLPKVAISDRHNIQTGGAGMTSLLVRAKAVKEKRNSILQHNPSTSKQS